MPTVRLVYYEASVGVYKKYWQKQVIKCYTDLRKKINETISSKKLRYWHVFCSRSRNDTISCFLMLAFILTVMLQTSFRCLNYHV